MPTTKWYAITFDRVLVALLLVVGLLYLSDQYDWFAFNRRKGWTVLIAVAVTSGVLLLTGLWAMASWAIWRGTQRKPFQFGLRSGMLLVAVVGLPCAWLGGAVRQSRQQEEICEAVAKAKGGILRETWGAPEHVPEWLVGLLGADFFLKVASASAVNDQGLLQIVKLSEVESLDLNGWVFDDNAASIVFPSDPAPTFSISALRKIQSLPGLKRLQLDAKELTASELASLDLPLTLERLKLDGDNLDDSTVEMIGKLSELRDLELDRSAPFVFVSHAPKRSIKITDGGLRHLSGLTKLRELKLSSTNLTDEALVHLKSLGELRELSIDDGMFDGNGFRHLEALSNLESLEVSSNKIADDNLKLLRAIPNLKSLNLSYTDVGDVGMGHLAQLPKLESLKLRWPLVSSKGILRLK